MEEGLNRPLGSFSRIGLLYILFIPPLLQSCFPFFNLSLNLKFFHDTMKISPISVKAKISNNLVNTFEKTLCIHTHSAVGFQVALTGKGNVHCELTTHWTLLHAQPIHSIGRKDPCVFVVEWVKM